MCDNELYQLSCYNSTGANGITLEHSFVCQSYFTKPCNHAGRRYKVIRLIYKIQMFTDIIFVHSGY